MAMYSATKAFDYVLAEGFGTNSRITHVMSWGSFWSDPDTGDGPDGRKMDAPGFEGADPTRWRRRG